MCTANIVCGGVIVWDNRVHQLTPPGCTLPRAKDNPHRDQYGRAVRQHCVCGCMADRFEWRECGSSAGVEEVVSAGGDKVMVIHGCTDVRTTVPVWRVGEVSLKKLRRAYTKENEREGSMSALRCREKLCRRWLLGVVLVKVKGKDVHGDGPKAR